MQIQLRVVAVALSIAFGSVTAACVDRSSADARQAPATLDTFTRMSDGKEWTTANLNVDTDGSSCYEDAELKLPSIWPLVHMGRGTTRVSIAPRRLAVADERRVAAIGETPRRAHG